MKVRASVKPCVKCKVIRRAVSSGLSASSPATTAPGLGENMPVLLELDIPREKRR